MQMIPKQMKAGPLRPMTNPTIGASEGSDGGEPGQRGVGWATHTRESFVIGRAMAALAAMVTTTPQPMTLNHRKPTLVPIQAANTAASATIAATNTGVARARGMKKATRKTP